MKNKYILKRGLITLNYVFIDLEMNEILDKTSTKKCKQEIIQIGAIKLNSSLKEIEKFSIYIKPSQNKIIGKIENLTGISNKLVEDSPNFNDAMDLFLDWLGEDFKIYAWSGNDYLQFKQECEFKEYKNEKLTLMYKNWRDFQREFCKLLDLDKGYQISLDLALDIVGKEFKGKRHNALYDARNTSYLFKISRNKENFKREYAYVKETLFKSKKEPFCTFGDFFTEDILKKLGGN